MANIPIIFVHLHRIYLRMGMKRLFSALLLALSVWTAAAQDHLRFEGLPLMGRYDTFTRQLRKKHFHFTTKDHQEPFMEGKVLGVRADVVLLVTPKTYRVYMVVASYPQRETWAQLKNQYDSMKMKLFARYGEPQLSLEQFVNRQAEEDPLAALADGTCSFVSNWEVPGGEIALSIAADAKVQIYFMDAEGMALAASEQ